MHPHRLIFSPYNWRWRHSEGSGGTDPFYNIFPECSDPQMKGIHRNRKRVDGCEEGLSKICFLTYISTCQNSTCDLDNKNLLLAASPSSSACPWCFLVIANHYRRKAVCFSNHCPPHPRYLQAHHETTLFSRHSTVCAVGTAAAGKWITWKLMTSAVVEVTSRTEKHCKADGI